MTNFPLNIVIKGIDRASRTFQRVQQNLDRVGRNMRDIGTKMTAGVTAPVGLLGATVIRTSLDFEKSMNRVLAKTNAAEQEFQSLENLAQELGSTTQFSASQAADGMTFLAQAGLEVNQILDALPGTLQLAAAGGLDLARAADISTNVMSAMGLEIDELGRLNNVLAQTASSANTDIKQMASAMRQAAPVANSTGVSVEELSSLIGTLANSGIQANKAGTGLKNALLKIPQAGKDARKRLAELGVSISDFVDESGKFTDFTGFIEALSETNVKATDLSDIVGLEAVPSLLALVDAEKNASGSIDQLTNKLRESEGAAERMSNQMLRGNVGAVKEFQSALEGLQLKIGESGVNGAFGKLIRTLTEFTREMTNANPTILRMGLAFAGTLAVIGPLAAGIGLLISAIGGVGVAVVGVIGAVAALVTAFSDLAKMANGIINAMKLVAAIMADTVVNAVASLSAVILDKLIAPFQWILSLVERLGIELPDSLQQAEQFSFAELQNRNQSNLGGAVARDIVRENGNGGGSAQIDVNFNNAPPGTEVQKRDEDRVIGTLDLGVQLFNPI